MRRISNRFLRTICAPRPGTTRSRRRSLVVQTLEDRAVPAQFTVTSLADDGSAGTLRDAISQANATPAGDQIVFDAGLFGTPQTIALTQGELFVDAAGGNLSITGPGATRLAVDGGGASRVLNSTAPTLSLTGFTIANGATDGIGGGILTTGLTQLDRMVVRDNSAAGPGGGIFVDLDGFLSVRNSTISGNSTDVLGGGIYFFFRGSLLVENSTISGNSGNFTGAYYAGYYGGGGILFWGPVSQTPPSGFTPGTIVVRNSTIVNNTVNGSGGGIELVQFSDTLLIENSTVSGNSAPATGSGPAGYPYGGGGVRDNSGFGTITVVNSIVSGNTNADGPDILSRGTVNVDYSAIGDVTGFSLTGNNNLIGQNLLLGPLQDNGGPTLTMAPQAGSVLIDAGSNALIGTGVTTDQRGLGFVRDYPTITDIGALEVQPPGLPFATAAATDITAPTTTPYQFTVTFDDPNGTNNGIQALDVFEDDTVIRVTGPNGFNQLATYVAPAVLNNGAPLVVTYQIDPPGGGWDVTEDGQYVVSIEPNQVRDLDSNFIRGGALAGFSVLIPQVLIVTNTDDSGPGSLRAAYEQAAAVLSDDTILFDPTVFGTAQTISLLSELTPLTPAGGALTVTGPGADLLTVQRDAGAATEFRLLTSYGAPLTLTDFTISGGLTATGTGAGGAAAFGALTMDGMVLTGNTSGYTAGGLFLGGGQTVTITNSRIVNNVAETYGGGLVVGSGVNLTLDNSEVSNNSAPNGGGGMIVAGNAVLTVINSRIADNTTDGQGGGIYANPGASVTVINSTISGNTASTNGGGIYFFSGGSLAVRESTISGNTTTNPGEYYGGGGIYFFGTANGPIEIVNSTIANNHSAGSGGGIMLKFFTGELNLVNSTISGNVADTTVAGYGGGGIYDYGGSNVVNLRNSVVSGNTNAVANDILSYEEVNAYNSLIFDSTGFTLTGDVNNLPPGTDPLLSPLQDNGGPTLTMSPLVGSPLIDAGDAAFVTGLADQRGLDRIDGGAPDIGAVEAQPAEVTINVGAAQRDPTNQTTVDFDVVFDQPITGFDVDDVVLSGTAAGVLVATVTPVDGLRYTVTVTGMTGDGTVIADIAADAAQNLIGQNSLASTSTDNTIVVDYTPPTVTINQAIGQLDPINTGPLLFDVVFSEDVVGLDPTAVVLTSSIGDMLFASVTPGLNPGEFVVAVSGMTGSSTVTATVPAGGTTDLAGNLNLTSTSTDNSIDYDITPPTVTINQAASQSDPGGGVSVVFNVVFSEPVNGFTGAAIVFTGSTAPGTLAATVSGAGPAYTVTVTGMTAGGTVVASIPTAAVTDLAGNDNLASTSTDNSVTFIRSGTVQFNAATYVIDETGAPSLLVTVTRVGGTEGPLSVNYTTVNGTAIAGTNFTATTGTLNWVDGDTTAQTFTVPILNDGVFGPDLQFGLALNTISLAGALGTPAAATVTIRGPAALAFAAANTPANEDLPGPNVKTVFVSRGSQSVGAVTVTYTITAGTATAGSDYTVPVATGILTWADGDTADKPINITILDDILSEGRETILLTLSNPTGNAGLGAQSTATVTIAHSEGQVFGVQFTDSDGDLVTPKLGGKVGIAHYYLTNGNGPISEIELAGTDAAKSTVTLAIKKPKGGTGDGRVKIGEITGVGTAGVKTLSLAKADLVGAGINLGGFLGSLTIGDIRSGADIILTGAAPPTPKNAATKITALVIEDGTDINSVAPLGNITATAVGNGSITAPIVGAINVKGRKANRTGTITAIAGDFKSDVTVSGAGILDPVKQKALKSLTAAGEINGATIDVNGNVGAVKAGAITNSNFDVDGTLGPITVKGAVTGSTLLADGNVGTVNVGSFVNSRLFAGYTGPDNGSGTFSAVPATIGPFMVKSKTDGFANSYVIASNFKNVTLASADVTNGTKFGFVYKTKFAGLTLTTPTGKKKYDVKLGGTQTIDTDLEVKKIP